jgi:hypothetical protein
MGKRTLQGIDNIHLDPQFMAFFDKTGIEMCLWGLGEYENFQFVTGP